METEDYERYNKEHDDFIRDIRNFRNWVGENAHRLSDDIKNDIVQYCDKHLKIANEVLASIDVMLEETAYWKKEFSQK